jgi:hypothetical protein
MRSCCALMCLFTPRRPVEIADNVGARAVPEGKGGDLTN